MLGALPLFAALTAWSAPDGPTTCGPHRTWTTVGRVGLGAEAVGLGAFAVALVVAPSTPVPELGITGASVAAGGLGTAVVGGIGMAATARSPSCALGRPGGLGAFGTFAVAGGLPVGVLGGVLFSTAFTEDAGVYSLVGFVFGGAGLLGGVALTSVGIWALVRHGIALDRLDVALVPDLEHRGVQVVGRF